MSRKDRARQAAETIQILEQGWYTNTSNERVTIADALRESVAGTSLHTPQALERLVAAWKGRLEAPQAPQRDTLQVTGQTTLEAARRLHQDGCERVMALNFASAKNPGGGFLGGSQAQEESLARASGLYATLLAAPRYYAVNRACGTTLYTDHMIVSPEVPVFREDDGALLDTPYPVTFLTAPAPNAGAFLKHSRGSRSQVRATMARRIACVLSLALQGGYDGAVLGAWGCGVFRNDPVQVAELFSLALTPAVRRRLGRVIFAVYDSTRDQRVLTAFEQALG